MDLPLAGQEHQHVAASLAPELVDGVDDRLHLVARRRLARAVAHLDRVRAPGDLDDRGVDPVAGEVAGEALGVDRRRRDDHLRSGRRGSSWRR